MISSLQVAMRIPRRTESPCLVSYLFCSGARIAPWRRAVPDETPNQHRAAQTDFKSLWLRDLTPLRSKVVDCMQIWFADTVSFQVSSGGRIWDKNTLEQPWKIFSNVAPSFLAKFYHMHPAAWCKKMKKISCSTKLHTWSNSKFESFEKCKHSGRSCPTTAKAFSWAFLFASSNLSSRRTGKTTGKVGKSRDFESWR